MDFLSFFAVLDPKGTIALAERSLMLYATLFMLIVAVPVFLLTFFFAWHYRAGNKKAKYTPEWEHSTMEEIIWWAIPFEIVLILGALTWSSTHELDPPRPLSEIPPVVIQAIALEWKWLFIYPEEGVASVNYLQMPVGTPVRFDITADAPMNAFWIPSLGGQMYAMTGMTNRLNLMAEEEGQYEGRSSNYSGDGFAKMQFTAEAVAPEEYEAWVQEASADPDILSFTEYQTLAEPSTENPVEYYGEVEANLYDKITGQFMDHAMEKFHFPAH